MGRREHWAHKLWRALCKLCNCNFTKALFPSNMKLSSLQESFPNHQNPFMKQASNLLLPVFAAAVFCTALSGGWPRVWWCCIGTEDAVSFQQVYLVKNIVSALLQASVPFSVIDESLTFINVSVLPLAGL